MSPTTKRMSEVVHRYILSCTAADEAGILECLAPNAVHYFPGWGPVRGAKKIAELWVRLAREEGSQWTIDRFLAGKDGAIIEWTHFRTKKGQILRGTEWYTFDNDGRIVELKAFYAAPRNPKAKTLQLQGYPYKKKRYPMRAPRAAKH